MFLCLNVCLGVMLNSLSCPFTSVSFLITLTNYKGRHYIANLICFPIMCLVPCCDVHYDFRINTTFGSSLPRDVCRRAHVFLTLFVCLCIVVSNTYCVVLLFCFLRLVASFSGWLIDLLWLTPLSAISWRPVSVETGVPGKNHRPWESNW